MKDKLVQSKMPQGDACDICKFNGRCTQAPLTKKNGLCPAEKGQYYPKKPIVYDYDMY